MRYGRLLTKAKRSSCRLSLFQILPLMGDARFTRLTNGFSWKIENDAAVSSHCMHHNFANTIQNLGQRRDPGDGRRSRVKTADCLRYWGPF